MVRIPFDALTESVKGLRKDSRKGPGRKDVRVGALEVHVWADGHVSVTQHYTFADGRTGSVSEALGKYPLV